MRNKNEKLKGSVLYTVVAVMMIMTVFVFAALSLASAANKRAFNSYANNQTQYTARSVVDTVWSIVQKTPEMKKNISDLPIDSELSMEVTGIDKSMGKLVDNKVTVQCLGKGREYGYDSNDKFYKMSVTVEMLGQRNTIAGYFLAEKIENPSFDYALVSLDSVGTNNFNIYGPLCFGSKTKNTNECYFSNDGKLSTPIEFNGDLNIRSADNVTVYPKTGIFVNGNFKFNNAGKLKPIGNYSRIYRELPYLYVANNFSSKSDDEIIMGSETSPLLLMAGSITQSGNNSINQSIYGDVYLYDDTESTIKASNVRQWNSDIILKRDNGKPLTHPSYTGGNLYSLGTVNVVGSGTLANNVVADYLKFNYSGNFNTSGSVTTRKIYLNGGNYKFVNGLFTNPDDFSCAYGTYVNDQEYFSPVMGGHYEEIYNENFDVENEAINNEMTPLIYEYHNKYVTNAVKNISFDFRDYIPEEASKFEITPTSITIDISKGSNWSGQEEKYYSEKTNVKCRIYEDRNGFASFSTEEIIAIGSDSKIIIPIEDKKFDVKSGRLEIIFEPTNWMDEGKNINVESISVQMNVKASKWVEVIVKEVNNLEFIKAVNDKAFTANNPIYIDDIDKSVKIEKYVDGFDGKTKLKIYKADLTGIEEGKELEIPEADYELVREEPYDYDTEYVEFLKSVISTVSFPETMGKENVLKSNGGFVDDDFLQMNSGKAVIQSNAEKQVTDAFENINKTQNLVYDFDNDIITNENGVTQGNITFPLTVISSCTFKGGLNGGEQIYFKGLTESKIYVKLDGFYMDNNCQSKDMMIVDDENGTKSVNFLIPKGENFTVVGNILTEYYRNNTEIMANPIVNNSGVYTVDNKRIPGIYFYMEEDTTSATIRFEYSHTSAYIIAPTGKLESDNVGERRSYSYIYEMDEEPLNVSCENAIIGAVICREANASANNRYFFYVNPNPKLPDSSDEKLHYEVRCMYYQAY